MSILPDFIIERATQLAQKAIQTDEVPVSAIIFNSQTFQPIAEAFNQTETLQNPLAHAEIQVIEQACRITNLKRLTGYSVFVSLEPCAMCAGALSWARVDCIYFGAFDPKTGAIRQGAQIYTHPQTHHKPQIVGGIEADRFGELLRHFFQHKRKNKQIPPNNPNNK